MLMYEPPKLLTMQAHHRLPARMIDPTESRAGLDVSYVEDGESGRRMLEIYEACETPVGRVSDAKSSARSLWRRGFRRCSLRLQIHSRHPHFLISDLRYEFLCIQRFHDRNIRERKISDKKKPRRRPGPQRVSAAPANWLSRIDRVALHYTATTLSDPRSRD